MAQADRNIARVARAQHGAFSRAQALDAGCSRDMVEWRLEVGAWQPTRFPSVYRLPSHEATWHQDLWAASLWAPPDGLIAGRSAAALYGLDRCPPGPVELLLPPESKHKAPRGLVIRRSAYPGRPRMVDGLPVVDPETALLGVARAVRADVLGDVLESAFDMGLTSPEKLVLAVGRRHGSGPIRRILDGRAPGRPRQSRLEGEFERLCAGAGIRLERQYEIRVRGKLYVVDYAAPQRRRGFELDGFGKLRTKAGKQAFLERATALALAGWSLLHFSWDDVAGRPQYVLDCVAYAETG